MSVNASDGLLLDAMRSVVLFFAQQPLGVVMPVYVGWIAVGTLGLIEITWLTLTGRTIANPSIDLVLAAWLLIGALLARSRWPQFSNRFHALAQNLCVLSGLILFTYLCATLNFPLRDGWFVTVDQAIGFDWLNWYSIATSSFVLSNTFRALYVGTFFIQLLGLMVLRPLLNPRRNPELILLFTLSSTACALISGFLPSVGPLFYLGVEPAYFHGPLVEAYRSLIALRSGLSVLDFTQLNGGLIVFPSFHAVVSIIFPYTLRGIGPAFQLSLVLNGLMLLAIPPVGGHYLADVFAGFAVAGLAIAATRGIEALINSGGLHRQAPDPRAVMQTY